MSTRLQVVVAATVPVEQASAWDFASGVRAGAEQQLEEKYGPGDYAVVVVLT